MDTIRDEKYEKLIQKYSAHDELKIFSNCGCKVKGGCLTKYFSSSSGRIDTHLMKKTIVECLNSMREVPDVSEIAFLLQQVRIATSTTDESTGRNKAENITFSLHNLPTSKVCRNTFMLAYGISERYEYRILFTEVEITNEF
jgi:hypothetical protein